VNTDIAAVCGYGTQAGLPFGSVGTNAFQDSVNGLTHTFVAQGLHNGQTYTYYARCMSRVDNSKINTSDYVITFNVAMVGTPPPPPPPPGNPPPPPPPPGTPPPPPVTWIPPTLGWPNAWPVDQVLQVSYNLNLPVSSVEWDFSPIYNPSGHSGVTAAAATVSFTTKSPSMSPAQQGLTVGSYLVTVRLLDANGVSQAQATQALTLVTSDLSSIRVYPNPWRSDKHSGKSIIFDMLPANCKVRIFTTSGRVAREFDNVNGSVSWDLTNESGDKVASGVYVFLITDNQGNKTRGKVAVVR
jgi:hypothetical protein